MFRCRLDVTRHLLCKTPKHAAKFTSSSCAKAHTNRPLNLDPALQALLKDVDMSLMGHTSSAPVKRELDIIPPSDSEKDVTFAAEPVEEEEEYEGRKSPAAHFGSRQFGSVVLPIELQNAITLLISGTSCAKIF